VREEEGPNLFSREPAATANEPMHRRRLWLPAKHLVESRLHFGERKIQPAEVMPGAVFGEMFDGLLQKSTGIGALMREQTRHATIEENGN
jgi:hypothetical protein